ncbi:hypothetical protein PsYK624_118140 [Phanerochaete sordida]|uniref:Uncharacterized protein n=1 Tax=Phanerochaete sordida TaxID=48140 RepID=A0A9P3GGL8_9APHY|nr:hypothetical protein PsYK624_118140 [Phanerochaete sordida]
MLDAILVRLDDGAWWGPPMLKRGLASCSLVCRHWAKAIRPMLFARITLRNADEVEQLLAFLAAPALLGQTVRSYVRSLHMIEDSASQACIPWSHQISLYLPRFSPEVSVYWTFEGLVAEGTDSVPSFQCPRLPRRLPLQTCQFRHVTLSHLRLPSVRSLADLVKDLPPTALRLLDVTFASEDPDLLPLQQSWPFRFQPLLRELHITRCFKGSAGLVMWLQISCLLFAGKKYSPPNDDVQTSMLSFLHLCVSLHGRQDSMSDLKANILPLLREDDLEHINGWNYHYTLNDIASLYIRTEDGIQPCIESASITCPHLDDAVLTGLDRLPSTFLDTAYSEPYPTSIDLRFKSPASCRPLLAAILDARVFTAPSAFVLRRFRVSHPDSLGYTVAEILSAPRIVGEGELCVALTTAQRVEWVLRQGYSANFVRFDKRDEYLRELQDAAREAGMVGAMDAGVVRVGS